MNMSKLDYITIGIVALCIMAIIFLVYKMTNVFKSDTPADNTESTTGPVEAEDDIYNYEADSTGTGEAVSDSTSSPASTPAETPSTNPATEEYADETPPAVEQPTTKQEGKFMVIAGAFTKKALAQAEADKMKKQGYSNARVEIFDRGKFAVILVDRFDNRAQAERLVKELRERGIECYVKTKEPAH
jgi:cell division septation protein DedD